jgi:hypothetical protein
MSAPALSIVVTGRNDGWGGDFNERFFATLAFNAARLGERGLAFELIFVEWNPVPGRPLLAELLAREFPALTGGVLRSFVAAPGYAAAFTQNRKVAFFEYIPKNAGIRRAAAPLVLVTNADVFLGREAIDAIATGRLARGTIYRAARYDIDPAADRSTFNWDVLENPSLHLRRPVLKPPLFSGATGDFLLAHHQTFLELRGFNEVYRASRAGVDTNILIKAVTTGHAIADIGGPVYHINHEMSLREARGSHRATPTDTPWGNLRWHYRQVSYENPDNWGLADAPPRTREDGIVMLDFDWRAVPPLIELRRVVPAAHHLPAAH